MSPDQDRFVVGTNGERLWIVDLNGEQVEIAGSEPFYPTWSPDGSQILVAFYPENPDGSVLGVVDANTGRVTNLTAQDGDSLTRDVPAGWLGQTPVFQRTYLNEPDRGVELWRAGDDAPFWSMDALEVYTAHPISVGQSFLLATSGGWLQVAADGGSTNLGPSAITERFTELLVGPAGMLAYAGQGQLVLAPLEAPGNLSGTFSYDGNGFDWSPDGSRLAVAAGSELLVLTPNGEVQATLAISSGGFVSGPYWTSQGILYMDSAANALQRVAAPS
jgi:dipeptidyl aminopeptidase/acylaminoacyl peptidase